MSWNENGPEGFLSIPETSVTISDINNQTYNLYVSMIIPDDVASTQIVTFNSIALTQFAYSRFFSGSMVGTFPTQPDVDFHFDTDSEPFFTISPFVSNTAAPLKIGVSWQVRSNGADVTVAPTMQILTWKWINTVGIQNIQTSNIAGDFNYAPDTSTILMSSN